MADGTREVGKTRYKQWLTDDTVQVPKRTKQRRFNANCLPTNSDGHLSGNKSDVEILEVDEHEVDLEVEVDHELNISSSVATHVFFEELSDPENSDVQANNRNQNDTDINNEGEIEEADLPQSVSYLLGFEDFSSGSEWSDCNSSGSESEGETETRNTHEDKLPRAEQNLPDENCHDPLYEGSPISVLTSYMLIFLFSIRHNLSKEALENLIKLIQAHLPSKERCVTSAYKLKDFFVKMFNEPEPTKHCFCSNCGGKVNINDKICDRIPCKKVKAKVKEFFVLDIKRILHQFFCDPEFRRNLNHRFKEDNDNARDKLLLRDIFDGKLYKEHMSAGGFLSEENNLSFSFNTDGVNIFKSSSKSNLWPIYLVVNELPPELRFSKKYMILCGLWCSSGKPEMLTFCKPIIDSINEVYDKGIQLETGEVVRAMLLLSTADLPAKALLTNMKQYNGESSCSVCEDPGETQPNCPLHRTWPYNTQTKLRSHRRNVKYAKKAVMTGKAVKGIKGASPFLAHKPFDLAKGFPIDWMHCVLLGVVKGMLKLWLSDSNKGRPYYIGWAVSY